MDLSEYYEEVVKTAGLTPAVEDSSEEEKIAAVVAITEQFDIDGIEFDSEDEKIAAAVEILEGFEKLAKQDPSFRHVPGLSDSQNMKHLQAEAARQNRITSGWKGNETGAERFKAKEEARMKSEADLAKAEKARRLKTIKDRNFNAGRKVGLEAGEAGGRIAAHGEYGTSAKKLQQAINWVGKNKGKAGLIAGGAAAGLGGAGYLLHKKRKAA